MRGLDRLWELHEAVNALASGKETINPEWLLKELKDCYDEIFEDGHEYYGEHPQEQEA